MEQVPEKARIRQVATLRGFRDPKTGQTNLMTGGDRTAYCDFTDAYVASLNPDGFDETQIALRIARDAWRLNRFYAIEDNIYANGHYGPIANMRSEHPEIHAALVTALVFVDAAKFIAQLTMCECRIRRASNQDRKELRKLQTRRDATPAKRENVMTATAAGATAEIVL